MAICCIGRVGNDVLQDLSLEPALQNRQRHQDHAFSRSLDKMGDASRFTTSKAPATNSPWYLQAAQAFGISCTTTFC